MDNLTEQARLAHQRLSPACRTYLEGRFGGHANQVADQFMLGTSNRGDLTIPYTTTSGRVLDIKVKCIGDHDCKTENHPKTVSMARQAQGLYQAQATTTTGSRIAIVEGEPDTWAATVGLDIPAVGVPGVKAWRSGFAGLFTDFAEVLVFAQGDSDGRTFARTVADSIFTARVIECPDGEDVASTPAPVLRAIIEAQSAVA